ncbi:MAG TPA: hypothetical protein PKM73_03660 [Verrucomicrobiota bacterium]|nr:hypothetical protein [Verrucomicrobiota bacterium]
MTHTLKSVLNPTLTLCALAAFLATPASMQAQERLPLEQAQRFAKFIHQDPKLLEALPLKVEADVTKPMAIRDEEHGGLLIPDARLTVESLAKVGTNAVPVGELWLRLLGVRKDYDVVPASQLNVIKFTTDNGQVSAPVYPLAVRQKSGGGLELLVYGKAKEPLLKLPLKAIDAKQELPLEADGERGGDGATVTLKIAGKYQASFEVGELWMD